MSRLWAYTWKSSDGIRHEETIEAPSRDEAFRLLREEGIRPIKVDQVLRPIDRAVDFARRFGIVLVVAAAVFTVTRFIDSGSKRTTTDAPVVEPTIEASETLASGRIATPLPRKQVSVAGVDLASVFKYEAERYLARFASPGALDDVATKSLPGDIVEALKSPITIQDDDSQEVVDLKRVVAGIKEDASLFLASGKSLTDIDEWLVLRQHMEADFRRQLIGGRDRDRFSKDAINAKLRAMGLQEL